MNDLPFKLERVLTSRAQDTLDESMYLWLDRVSVDESRLVWVDSSDDSVFRVKLSIDGNEHIFDIDFEVLVHVQEVNQ